MDDMSKGAARAHRFLKDFSDLPLDTMDLKQALLQIGKLKDDLEKDAVNCHWLQQFFQLSLDGAIFELDIAKSQRVQYLNIMLDAGIGFCNHFLAG